MSVRAKRIIGPRERTIIRVINVIGSIMVVGMVAFMAWVLFTVKVYYEVYNPAWKARCVQLGGTFYPSVPDAAAYGRSDSSVCVKGTFVKVDTPSPPGSANPFDGVNPNLLNDEPYKRAYAQLLVDTYGHK
jgi:hypothetical protein